MSEKTKDRLNNGQLRVLGAISDTLFPSIPAPAKATDGEKRFYETTPSDYPDFMETVETTICTTLNSVEVTKTKVILTLLSTAMGSAAIIPCAPYLVAFPDRTLEEREAALLSLFNSSFEIRRTIVTGLKKLILFIAFSFIEKDENGDAKDRFNPFWEHLKYPGPPRSFDSKTDAQEFKDGVNNDYLLSSISISEDCEKEFDIVIIGSGAGGGVTAGTLSKLGYRVLVLEKGKHIELNDITQLELDGLQKMYEKEGSLTTEDGSVSILAGSTLGGGTAINWACSLDTPSYVRKEWAEKLKLDQFHPDSKEFNVAMDTVKKRMGVTSDTDHTPSNQMMQKGCDVLGITTCETAPQNFKHTRTKSSGWSCLGDRYGNKQGTRSTYLVDAAKHNTQFIHEASVERIVYSDYLPKGSTTKRKRATGVVARVGEKGYKVTIKATKCVVLSGGSLHSPCVLLRSGFKNAHIGKHLRLHPVTSVLAFNSTPINIWSGNPMTMVTNECVQGPNNDGYGAKLESPSVHPGLMGSSGSWTGMKKIKNVIGDLSNGSTIIVLQRDKDSEGQVEIGPDGFNPRVHYKLGENDKRSMMHSLTMCIRIAAATGANMLGTMHNADTLWDTRGKTLTGPGSADQQELEDYIKKVEKLGIEQSQIGLFSAHQMGSNRMGTDKKDSVVDCNGELWECDDLFVFDASIFPTASGANPMITTMSIAQMLSSRLGDRLCFEDGKLVGGTKSQVAQAKQIERESHRFNITQTPTSGYASSWTLLFASITVGVISYVLKAKYELTF